MKIFITAKYKLTSLIVENVNLAIKKLLKQSNQIGYFCRDQFMSSTAIQSRGLWCKTVLE